jgi:hypothetical protein
MTDLITIKPSIGVLRHPSIRLWNKPSIDPCGLIMTRGGVYRGVGVGVSEFHRGVMRVRVSRNSILRHPPGATRGVFNRQGWGVALPVKLKIIVIYNLIKYIRKLIKALLPTFYGKVEKV